ncbi:hypothetical protein [Paenibacillus wynnii]|uniref:YgiT-type zinc finger domain-containing protein n=1 Tax=Paenibacillus wynnii TaxID=268407 RepID=A0A098M3S0_9BACL|nr:hypothetical protein [Paenibacillus wynnii]KGE16678.1 hypothetical protein PWYN_18430 [Paenibacillus wynnii]
MQKDNLLKKLCCCGGGMTIHMHTLIYSAKVKITGVPVYTCGECSRYEPLPSIKRDLGMLIKELGGSSNQRQVSFAERNEWANVLKETLASFNIVDLSHLDEAINAAIQGRIDLLLDIYQFASARFDREWMEETANRLSQLTQSSPERAK